MIGNMRKKNYFLRHLFIFFLLGILITLPKVAKEESSTTFPVEKAGIAAYVRLDNIENIDLRAFANACDSIEELKENYIIGTVKVENAVGTNEPHIYVGGDGWIVAYYLKDEPSAKVMQWKGYTTGTISTTILKDAIDQITKKVGVNYSDPIKYYHFKFKDANKMTLIAETQGREPNDFYVTVPGTLYEASYGVLMKNGCSSGSECRILQLKIDDKTVYKSYHGCSWSWSPPFSTYGYYDLSDFEPGVTHHIVFYNGCAGWTETETVTALIYKN
ncbi:MAG: hypothetical protein QXO12_03160 [Candidatus Pacearchaeota archaeon]